jgi:hypothetical protein
MMIGVNSALINLSDALLQELQPWLKAIQLLQSAVYGDESEIICRKDTGQGKKLRK